MFVVCRLLLLYTVVLPVVVVCGLLFVVVCICCLLCADVWCCLCWLWFVALEVFVACWRCSLRVVGVDCCVLSVVVACC